MTAAQPYPPLPKRKPLVAGTDIETAHNSGWNACLSAIEDQRLDTLKNAELSAQAIAQPPEAAPAYLDERNSDSAELRRLCQARDDARRERDLRGVEIAALESTVGHLSRLVDELRPDSERLEWVLRRCSGNWLRTYTGVANNTGDMVELRTLIDANRGANADRLAATTPKGGEAA